MSDLPCILERAQAGDPRAAEELLPLVYDQLRKLAAHKMANQLPGQTLQPTALVHEAWLRLVGGGQQHWNSRGHFFAAAPEAMRRILIEAIQSPTTRELPGLGRDFEICFGPAAKVRDARHVPRGTRHLSARLAPPAERRRWWRAGPRLMRFKTTPGPEHSVDASITWDHEN